MCDTPSSTAVTPIILIYLDYPTDTDRCNSMMEWVNINTHMQVTDMIEFIILLWTFFFLICLTTGMSFALWVKWSSNR